MTIKRAGNRPVFYRLQQDEESGAMYLVDMSGQVPDLAKHQEVLAGLQRFVATYDLQEDSARYGHNKYHEWSGMLSFHSGVRMEYEENRRKGTLFLFKELGTNYYRFAVTTKHVDDRMSTLQGSFPVAIDLICHRPIFEMYHCRKFLESKFMGKKDVNGWYLFDEKDIEYFRSDELLHDFERYLPKKKKNYTCSNCGRTVSLKDGYYINYVAQYSEKQCSKYCAIARYEKDNGTFDKHADLIEQFFREDGNAAAPAR